LRFRIGVALVVLLHVPGVAFAQDTRAEEVARLQAEKAQQLRPYEPSRGEKAIDLASRMLAAGHGAYPWVGSAYPGGSFTLGAGYRHSLGDTGVYNLLGGWSVKNYKVARADVKLPEFAHRHIVITAHGGWLDAPEVAFYGLGNDSPKDGKTTYEYTPTTVGATGTLRLTNWLSAGAGADYLSVDSSIADVTYLVSRAGVGIDWRPAPDYSRRGGLYRLEWTSHDDRDVGTFTFRQLEAELVQLLPLFHESSIIALRGLATTTDVDAGQTIPVFMLPSLGGGTNLRGYPSWRFRDRHRLLLSAEYRWTPAQVIDMALFADAGKVAANRSDLYLDGLKSDIGIGVRLHGPSFTALRLDFARGREGWVINIGGGAAF